jgi:hypothetical protein
LSSNSLANDGKDVRAATVDFVPGFEAHSFVHSAVRTSENPAMSVRKPNRDPHILLATTGQLPSTARIAMELHDAGARVSLISPGNHPAKALDFLAHRLTYRAIAPQRCLEAALLRLQPELVILCDERTVRDVHALRRKTHNREVKRLLQKSTAPAENYQTITSRADLLDLARREGVRVPPSMPLPDSAALDQWIANHPTPFVLKADGSWAGFGVRVISEAGGAKNAFVQMTRPASGLLGLRELFLEGNNFYIRPWLRRERPAMSVQDYIDGRPANIGVACWKGEVLAAVCAEAVATESATGPSTVVRIIHNAEMMDAARRIVSALHLTGLIGFDFIIESATEAAWLIEMNPRNTPICALRLGQGRDLAEALVARLAGRPVRERAPRTDSDVVVFFPDTWQLDPSNAFLRSGYHDVPWEQPALVRKLMRAERRERYWVFRTLRRLWLAVRPDSSGTG